MKDLGDLIWEIQKTYILAGRNQVPVDYSIKLPHLEKFNHKNISKEVLQKENLQLIELYHLKKKVSPNFNILFSFYVHAFLYGFAFYKLKSPFYNYFYQKFVQNSAQNIKTIIYKGSMLSFFISFTYTITLLPFLAPFEPIKRFKAQSLLNDVTLI